MALRILPPSTVIAVWFVAPPSTETENSALYCEVVPGEMVTPGLSAASCKKLRPLSGKSSILSRVITLRSHDARTPSVPSRLPHSRSP